MQCKYRCNKRQKQCVKGVIQQQREQEEGEGGLEKSPCVSLIVPLNVYLYKIGQNSVHVVVECPPIAVVLAKLADCSCSIIAYVVMASYFWKNLRNG